MITYQGIFCVRRQGRLCYPLVFKAPNPIFEALGTFHEAAACLSEVALLVAVCLHGAIAWQTTIGLALFTLSYRCGRESTNTI